MMILRDLVYGKEMLEMKVSELKAIMKYDTSESIAQELFAQLDLLQAKKVNINTVNNQVNIDLSGKEVSVSIAVVVRDTIKEKIDVLTGLIVDNECKLDKLELMKQRDDIYAEYTLLSHKIAAIELNTKVGK